MADAVAQGSNSVPVGKRKKAAEDISHEADEWTGEIRRANADGSEIRGFLVDKWGYRVELRGHKDPRPGHGFFLYGKLVIPARLRVEAIDA